MMLALPMLLALPTLLVLPTQLLLPTADAAGVADVAGRTADAAGIADASGVAGAGGESAEPVLDAPVDSVDSVHGLLQTLMEPLADKGQLELLRKAEAQRRWRPRVQEW